MITALSTARVGSIWKPPILQQMPAGVRRRISSARMTLRYDANHTMTGGRDVSPFAVPVMLEIGRESIHGEASEALLAEAEAQLVKEAMR